MFTLNKTLEDNTFFVRDLSDCRLLLMNNANYLWLILVPKKENAIEFTDLDFADQIDVLKEINLVVKILQKKFHSHKINIATLGNIVRQLHIHIIARFENDVNFPNSVWCDSKIKQYDEDSAKKFIAEINSAIDEKNVFIKQLLYRSIHRGCKETDFLIGEFAKNKIEEFDDKKLLLLQKFIAEDDLLIYDWILNKIAPNQEYQDLIADIQKFHSINK
jgi:diadenosine tetraphosphate (Ap4A) HIT family hydrolase